MYRRLVALWVVVYALLPVAVAYGWLGATPTLSRFVDLITPDGPSATGTMTLILSVLIANLFPLAVGVALAWVSAFNPGRRTKAWEIPLRGLGALAFAAYAAGLLLSKAQAAAASSTLLAAQVGKPPWLVLTAAQAPHRVVEGAALGLVFTVPIFWAIRTPQVRSFVRSSFEAWAEARRLAIVAVLLVAVAAMIEVLVSPATTAMLFQ